MSPPAASKSLPLVRRFRIKTVGTAIALLLLGCAVVIVLTSREIVREVRDIGVAWESFDQGAAKKSDLLSELRGLLGYGGMIHGVKKFVLRKERESIITVHEKLFDVTALLFEYPALGVNQEESRAIGIIYDTVRQYAGVLAIAEKMASQGDSTRVIDEVIRINDAPALKALGVLDRAVRTARAANARLVYDKVATLDRFVSSTEIAIGVLLIVLIVSFLWFTRTRLVTPLLELGGVMQRLARGETDLDIPGLEQDDEIGDMAKTVEVFKRNEIRRQQTEEQLRQAQKMEAVGQLTGGIAHDFNNLLMVILGNAEILDQAAEKDERRLGEILLAAERGSELTQRLLAFSRRQPLRPQVIDMAVLLTGLAELVRRTLRETIEVEVITAPDLWRASADPGQVENAVLNLAINARDAMPSGGKLTIQCTNIRFDDPSSEEPLLVAADNPGELIGDYLMLAVTDTGTGMTDEIRNRAFEPFFTTKEVGDGSGLGLSMIYGFAKQSGGHVSIFSLPGHGTTVTLYLPRAHGAPSVDVAEPATDLPRGRGQSILVIEDDDNVRSLAVRMLEGLDYQTIAVSDAAGAEQVLEGATKIDLVLSDVVLPGGMSGPEFAHDARTRNPGLRFIFMSGYPAKAAMQKSYLGGGEVLLSKPFRQLQLADAVHDALNS